MTNKQLLTMTSVTYKCKSVDCNHKDKHFRNDMEHLRPAFKYNFSQ